MGDQQLWLMTAVRGRVVTKGPTLHFHGVTLGKACPILARSSSLCLQKLPGTVRCWLGVDRWEGKGHPCLLTPPPPRQERPSLVSITSGPSAICSATRTEVSALSGASGGPLV